MQQLILNIGYLSISFYFKAIKNLDASIFLLIIIFLRNNEK